MTPFRALLYAFTALLVVSAVNAVVAVHLDIACDLDCEPDDTVTWSDAVDNGTGISPPPHPLVAIAVGVALASRRGWAGIIGATIATLAPLVMVVAWWLDGATWRALSPFDPVPGTLTLLLLAVVLMTLGAAAWTLVERIRGPKGASRPRSEEQEQRSGLKSR